MDKYVTNAKGAKIYEDISKHDKLDLSDGDTFSLVVLSLGSSLYKGEVTFYLTTQRDDGKLQVYVLPNQYGDWANSALELSKTVNLFPAQVEFSLLNGKFGADIQ